MRSSETATPADTGTNPASEAEGTIDMPKDGATSGPARDSANGAEEPARPDPEPPQHCPACGQEMLVEAGYWVCSDQKCGTRIRHEFHSAEELSNHA